MNTKNTLGPAIWAARRVTMLTQDQLGKHVGVLGRTIHRWERGYRHPSPRHRRALLAAIQVLAPAEAPSLAIGLGLASAPPESPAAPAAAGSNTPTLELLLLRAADELDLSPRRLRATLSTLFAELSRAGLSLAAVQAKLEQWPS
jgi:DNA-binding XRE family transcriptional regulator